MLISSYYYGSYETLGAFFSVCRGNYPGKEKRGKMVAIGGTKDNIKLSSSDRNLYFEQQSTQVAQKIGSFVF